MPRIASPGAAQGLMALVRQGQGVQGTKSGKARRRRKGGTAAGGPKGLLGFLNRLRPMFGQMGLAMLQGQRPGGLGGLGGIQ
jgi:hypothetical protein